MQQPRLALTAPGGTSTSAASAAATRERPPAEQERGREREQRRGAEQRPLRPDERDRDQRRQERAEQRAGRRERVEAAGDRARGRDVVIASRIANGATIPSSTTAGAKSSRTAKNEPMTAPAEVSSRLPTVSVEERPGDER